MFTNDKIAADINYFMKTFQKWGDWKFTDVISKGDAGLHQNAVYSGKYPAENPKFALLKVQSASMERCPLKLEIKVLKEAKEDKAGPRPHFPQLLKIGGKPTVKNNYYVLVTSLPGPNLEEIKTNHGMPLRTWCRLGIQCLYAVKTVHEMGFVHRNIRPTNFVLGHSSDPLRARVVHIVDYNHLGQFSFIDEKNKRRHMRPRETAAKVRGSFVYSSATMAEMKEQGRKDDLWSLLYVLFSQLYGPLPWDNACEIEAIEKGVSTMKGEISDEEWLKGLAGVFGFLTSHLKDLDWQERPLYSLFYESLNRVKTKAEVEMHDPYEWETSEEAEKNKAVMLDEKNSKHFAFLDPGYFFAYDYIKCLKYTENEDNEANKRNMDVSVSINMKIDK